MKNSRLLVLGNALLILFCLADCTKAKAPTPSDDPVAVDDDDDDSSNGESTGVVATVRFLNGPTAAGARGVRAVREHSAVFARVPADGNWLLSPNEMTFTATEIQITGGGDAQAVNCPIPFSAANPGLTSLGDCEVTLEPGTYDSINITLSPTYDVLIDDGENGFYSTPDGIVTAAPEGGAEALTIDSGSTTVTKTQIFDEPLVVTAGSEVTISAIVQGLQFFEVAVSGGEVTLGDSGIPDMVISVNSITKLAYYVNADLDTAGSYCSGGDCVSPLSEGFGAISAFYTSEDVVAMVGVAAGSWENCGASMLYPSFVNETTTYQGLDADGNISWAMFSDAEHTTYSAEFVFAQAADIGDATTLYCADLTEDPAPSGGSFSSGAPDIATEGNALATFTLVAQ